MNYDKQNGQKKSYLFRDAVQTNQYIKAGDQQRKIKARRNSFPLILLTLISLMYASSASCNSIGRLIIPAKVNNQAFYFTKEVPTFNRIAAFFHA